MLVISWRSILDTSGTPLSNGMYIQILFADFGRSEFLQPRDIRSECDTTQGTFGRCTNVSLSENISCTDMCRDEQLVEALQSKEFKIITITHGQRSLIPEGMTLTSIQSTHPPASCHLLLDSPSSLRTTLRPRSSFSMPSAPLHPRRSGSMIGDWIW